MNQNIANIQEKILQGKGITKEEVLSCQNSIESEEDLFYVYWIMSRYYLDRNQEDAMTYCVLKCYELNEKNHFDLPFKVKDFATKIDIEKAVKGIFGVDIIKVNIVKAKGKTKRFRGKIGKKSNVKKAIVTMKKGQQIDLTKLEGK